MRAFIIAATLAASLASTSAFAQAASSSAPAAAYTTAATDIGTLLDDPAAKAVLDKYIPGFSAGANVEMARAMTLKSVQEFRPEMFTDKLLADIDAELAKLAAK